MPHDRFQDLARQARSGVLATAKASGEPHAVPIVFAIDAARLVTAIDHKPKTTHNLKRISNIEQNPSVAVLIDDYHDDWSRLWWVRVDGSAAIIHAGPTYETGIELLVAKYEHYRHQRPSGPLIDVTITRISGWEATAGV